MTKKRSPETILLRVAKGALVPADDLAAARLRQRGYAIGDTVSAELRQSRNPGFHRLAHALGGLVAANVESFSGLNGHQCLKRLQWESGAGCDEMAVNVPNVGMMNVRIPRSLAFDSMSQEEFYEVYTQLCRQVAKYWPGLDEHEVQRMAECFTREAA